MSQSKYRNYKISIIFSYFHIISYILRTIDKSIKYFQFPFLQEHLFYLDEIKVKVILNSSWLFTIIWSTSGSIREMKAIFIPLLNEVGSGYSILDSDCQSVCSSVDTVKCHYNVCHYNVNASLTRSILGSQTVPSWPSPVAQHMS